MVYKQKYLLCNEAPVDCHFELKTFPVGTTIHNEMLCAGEIMFVSRQSEYTGTTLSDVIFSLISLFPQVY